MKKLIVLMLLMAMMPVMAAEYTIGGQVQAFYFMDMPLGDEIANSQFGTSACDVWVDADLGDDLAGRFQLNVADISEGMEDSTDVNIEEMWISKKGAFGQEALSMKFGKMEVPFNLDYDNSITHSLSNSAYVLVGAGPDVIIVPGEIDNVWGLSVSYMVEGVGTFSLTTFEGAAGLDTSDTDPTKYTDEDTGLFSSLAVQWDTGKGVDAFGVAGLRLVVGIAMLAMDEDADNAQVVSLGATYTGVDKLTLALEIAPMISNINSEDGSMFYELSADYDVTDVWTVGLTYGGLTVTGDDAMAGAEDSSLSRMALRGWMKINDAAKLQIEYVMSSLSDDDYTDAELEAAVHGNAVNSVSNGLRIGVYAGF
mgnify:CR=1 FL=1